jgi:hypothetical protein
MKNNKYALVINSCLIAITTFILSTILHELGHFFLARYFDIPVVLHHNYVDFKDASPIENFSIAAAGPITSLILGIFFLILSKKNSPATLLKLFFFWLGMNCLLSFMGYILIAPFVPKGDTGFIFKYLEIPLYIGVPIAMFSFVLIQKKFKKSASNFEFYKPVGVFNKSESARQLILYPIIAMIVFNTILAFPIINYASLLPTLFMPLGYIGTYFQYKETGRYFV